MKTITFIATTVILFASVLSVAKAAPPSDLPTAVVKFGDLDATYPAGQEELYRRLSRAVRTVCSPLQEAPGSIAVGKSRNTACIDRADSDALARINRRAACLMWRAGATRPAGAGGPDVMSVVDAILEFCTL
jgi:UrcA family protein